MNQSYEEEEETGLKTLCSDIIITEHPSLFEKSIIFSRIEHKLTEEKNDTLYEQLKYNTVLHQLKMNTLHVEYNRKLYNVILRQLVKDHPERLAAKFWRTFISSF
jgi:hypothetical protein